MRKARESHIEKKREEAKPRYHPRSKSEKISPPKPKPDYEDKNTSDPNAP